MYQTASGIWSYLQCWDANPLTTTGASHLGDAPQQPGNFLQVTGADTWQTLTVPITLPAGTQYAAVVLNTVYSGQTPTTALTTIDNVIVTPEPATLCLLGFGGLAMLRRKKS